MSVRSIWVDKVQKEKSKCPVGKRRQKGSTSCMRRRQDGQLGISLVIETTGYENGIMAILSIHLPLQPKSRGKCSLL